MSKADCLKVMVTSISISIVEHTRCLAQPCQKVMTGIPAAPLPEDSARG